jgi:hypothetical protein
MSGHDANQRKLSGVIRKIQVYARYSEQSEHRVHTRWDSEIVSDSERANEVRSALARSEDNSIV